VKLKKFAAIDERVRFLQDTNRRLMAQLTKARVSKQDLVDAVYRAASDGIANLDIKPVVPPRLDKRQKSAETAVAVLSDWQLAKMTETYSSKVCEERIEKYAEKVIALTDIQRADHPVRDCRVYLLGDILEAELIFPGQAHAVDASLYRQVTIDGPRILSNFLRKMLSHFDHVHAVGVIGNHGAIAGFRIGRQFHPESNADRMLYRIVQQILEPEKRLTWNIPDGGVERKWYATDLVGEKTFFLFHGDQVRGTMLGFPWYGFGRRLQGWRNGAIKTGGIPIPFDYALSGHFHTPVRLFLNTITLWGNGSTESSNEYAAENMAAAGEPCQWLLFSHPKHGVTAEYLVHLA